jgi:hypothetical protein
MVKRIDLDSACECCFDDKKLIQFIKEKGVTSSCAWCGAINVKVIHLAFLGEEFRKIVSLYEPVHVLQGDTIGYLLQEDWEIFSSRIDEKNCLQEITLAILEAGVDRKDDVDIPLMEALKDPPLVGLKKICIIDLKHYLKNPKLILQKKTGRLLQICQNTF